jgi:hypothetical protein
MSILIRRSELQGSDRELLVGMFRRHLAPEYDVHRFDWLYRQGPHGEAVAWLAVDSSTNEVVGAAAAFPRKIYLNGEVKLGLVLGDFCMNENYRSLGPSLQLQRACVEVIRDGQFEFFYDLPSTSMMAVYKRLGIPQTGFMFRWAKFLRAEAKLERIVRSKTLAKGASVIVNAALARRGWKGEKSACDLELQEGFCGEDFTRFDEEVRPRAGIHTVRTAAYLNWRYRAPATSGHQIIKAHRHRTLVGYVVYKAAPDGGHIMDLGSLDEPAVIARLLSSAVQSMAASGVATVNLNAIGTHPWNAVFERAGFQRREHSPAVICWRQGAAACGADSQRTWYAMQGERDS